MSRRAKLGDAKVRHSNKSATRGGKRYVVVEGQHGEGETRASDMCILLLIQRKQKKRTRTKTTSRRSENVQ